MASNLLNIVYQDSQQIDEKELKFIFVQNILFGTILKRLKKNMLATVTTRRCKFSRDYIIYLHETYYWDHFKTSKEKYASHSDNEKMQILKRLYTDLVPVYYGLGKNFCCCNDCMFVDDGRRQDCLKCKVNVLYCDCSSDD